MGTLRPINPHTASLIVNPQAAAHDYDNLTHKPQINGHELSGDQSGSDLGLQNQLTAGDNVTIENGVISASGGVSVTVSSAAVNQNGTITFTNSDGTTFTTTGTSIIGFSPTATVTQTQSGATVSITDKNGTTTANISNGQDGNDYVLTAQDKSDIADIVLSELPNADTMSF